jgi:hypothetical protein
MLVAREWSTGGDTFHATLSRLDNLDEPLYYFSSFRSHAVRDWIERYSESEPTLFTDLGGGFWDVPGHGTVVHTEEGFVGRDMSGAVSEHFPTLRLAVRWCLKRRKSCS